MKGCSCHWLWTASILISLIVPAAAQTSARLDVGTLQLMNDARKQSPPLSVAGNIPENISVEAVLLPASMCKHVFGKQVSNNYAAVELTISNRNANAALIVESIFIDYNSWALSGSPLATMDLASSSRPAGSRAESQAHSLLARPWETSNKPNQIASVEYRIVRGQALDRQPWTARNATLRALQTAGSLAAAFTFSINERGIVKGVNAYNGQVVPSAQLFWPDSTIAQLNRTSDVGFQVNRVIPQNGSDIIVAFFPIDRFITPGLKKLYLKSPAVFFTPYSMLLDREVRESLAPMLSWLAEAQAEESCSVPLPPAWCSKSGKERSKEQTDLLMRKIAAVKLKDMSHRAQLSEEEQSILTAVDSLSLNHVNVYVSSVLAVDTNAVSATISLVHMDGGDNTAALWTKPGEQIGTIAGSYLFGGTPIVVNGDKLGITSVKAIAQGSTATALHFALTLDRPIPAGTVLAFRVDKTDKNNQPVQSATYSYKVDYPHIDSFVLEGTTLKINGHGF